MAKETFYSIFRQLNKTPRPSHHEGRVADFLCQFAEDHGLKYRRDEHNCVVIEKPASPGCENAEPVVILNHMDMVCVAKDGYLRDGRPFDALTDEIRPVEYEEDGARWMCADGTSLGADNGIGLSMALAILADDSLVHPALEVLTTTNEEDGMDGAEGLSTDFIKGRKVINLDSEAYDEITVGAAGVCLQVGHWTLGFKPIPAGNKCFKIRIDGGLGGHSGVDINKGRCNCNKFLTALIAETFIDDNWNFTNGLSICSIQGGTANASIASWAEAVVTIPEENIHILEKAIDEWKKVLYDKYHDTDAGITLRCEETLPASEYIADFGRPLCFISRLPFGVWEMRKDMPGTVMTSNNIGVIAMQGNNLTVSCHTRSFDENEQNMLSNTCHDLMISGEADDVEKLMNTGAWMEKEDSPLLALTCQTFKDVLGFEPKKVAMHFVLEAAYYVEKYPGIEIASIGPKIIEPHSTSERVNLDTADNIWKVTVELLKRLCE
ncbi:MAG: beta-Ala-His dipeptidase [Prevotellaceae bacterium]|nr:beta-Ala-His dipeptidase [Prevotellaceae bacterium]